ncbi:Crp/Fnr family transcriptional regulator [Actinomadura macrotermitis]|uniref:CRP-like cAMP-activated global transcriptional regulator n=1 Tax=Actinomadura macrotermitis TaxID=2585200 RepID=A0A7K0C7S1_9ACTN|nr:Crp/Fnr family transcriptional regulator [Actinomadura macrotermitis]MQY09483.1 CRP-like cAMP-activated global transcriptional regulator [Actinomadura macrotermitis]
MHTELQGLGRLLPPQTWNKLLAEGAARRFSEGELLLRQGDAGTHVLLLTSGHIKVTRLEPDGEELLLAVRGPGEVIGELAVLDESTRSANVLALTQCITYVLAASRFRRILTEFDVEGMVLRHVIGRYREGEEVRAELAELPAEGRVARVLLRFASAVGGPRPVLCLSQDELAGAAGLSRAAFAAELGKLRERNVVATGRRRVTICDPARLRETLPSG